MKTFLSRPRWLRPRPSLCLRTSSPVWLTLDREQYAYRRWQTQNADEFAWPLRVSGLLTTSADLFVALRALCHCAYRATVPRILRKQSP
jgi:hypothetical protein